MTSQETQTLNTPSMHKKDFSNESFTNILAKILPILLKLLLANTQASKIECFIELASVFSLEDLAKATLSSMDSPTDQPSQAVL